MYSRHSLLRASTFAAALYRGFLKLYIIINMLLESVKMIHNALNFERAGQ